MSKVEFANSSLIGALRTEVHKRCGGFIDDKVAAASFKAMMCGATAFLATVKSTKTPMALTVTDTENNFIVGAVVQYNESPEEVDETSGNWNYFWTFNKEDIPEDAVEYDIKSEKTHKIVMEAAFQYASAKYNGSQGLIEMFTIAFNTLKDYLMEAAQEGDTYELVDPGVFTAQSAVEDGEKVISIIPDGLIKKLIKDDSALEKENESK